MTRDLMDYLDALEEYRRVFGDVEAGQTDGMHREAVECFRGEGSNFMTPDVFGLLLAAPGVAVEISTGFDFNRRRVFGFTVRPRRDMDASQVYWSLTECREAFDRVRGEG